MQGIEMTLTVKGVRVAILCHETMDSVTVRNIWESQKRANQNCYGVNDLCTPSVLWVVPVPLLKKLMLDLPRFREGPQKWSVLCDKSSQAGWDSPAWKKVLGWMWHQMNPIGATLKINKIKMFSVNLFKLLTWETVNFSDFRGEQDE